MLIQSVLKFLKWRVPLQQLPLQSYDSYIFVTYGLLEQVIIDNVSHFLLVSLVASLRIIEQNTYNVSLTILPLIGNGTFHTNI